MKIAIIGARTYPPAHGGLDVVVAELAREYALAGHTVAVFVSEAAPGLSERGDEGINEVSGGSLSIVPAVAIRTKHLQTISQLFASRKAIRDFNADFIHIHGVGAAIPLGLSRSFYGTGSTVVTCHGLDWDRKKWSTMASWFFKVLSLHGLRHAHILTAVSEPTARSLSAAVRRPVSAISNGFRKPESLANGIGFKTPPHYALTVARLSEEKGVHTTVAAYDSALERKFGPLLVVGGGSSSHSGRYEGRVRQLAAGNPVEFLGEQSRDAVFELMNGASLLISASSIEGQPLTVMEAMSVGVPLVLSDIAEHRALAQGAATYFEVGDNSALKAVLESHPTDAMRAPASLPSWKAVASEYVSSCGVPRPRHEPSANRS